MVWLTKPPLGTPLDLSHPLNTGLAAFWVFNEGSGDIVNDLSGNANTGTLTNMAFPSTTTSGWNPGKLGPAIAFDSTNDYILYGTSSSFIGQNHTIEMQVNIRDNGILYAGLFSKQYLDGITFCVNGLNLLMYINSGGATTTYNTFFSANTWVRVSLIVKTDTFEIYKNGVRVLPSVGAETFTGNLVNSTALNCGRWSDGGLGYFGGIIDEVRIWNRELTPSEILSLDTEPYSMFVDSACSPLICTLDIQ